MGTINTFDENSPEIQYLCKKDKRLAKVISMVGPLTYETHDDPYEFLIHEIIDQMLSVKASNKIFLRLVDLCGGKITPSAISQLTIEQLRSTGTSRTKAQYIKLLTISVLNNDINLSELNNLPDEIVYKKLTSLKGVGSWTAKMYLIFVLNKQDILPFEDVAFLQSFKWMYMTPQCNKNFVEQKCKKWKPHSSMAARYLYKALDTGLTKEEFHLYK